ncbi:MAG: response regulator [Pseudomonadales bacterium]|nr:response regulator [Pseudomonadales bacterium]
MEFTAEEVNELIKASAVRSKKLRKKIDATSPGTEAYQDLTNAYKILNGIIKKLLPLQQKKDTPAEPKTATKINTKPKANYSQHKVLIVDDDATTRALIKMMLADAGFKELHECTDGHEAIAQIKQPGKPYDLVLCDWNMPVMSGLDVLKLLRKTDKFKKMPFIMISGQGDIKNIKEAMQSGVSDYIVKPIDEEKFNDKLASVLPA